MMIIFIVFSEVALEKDGVIMNQLIQDCGSSGDVIVYNIGFERGKLNDWKCSLSIQMI